MSFSLVRNREVSGHEVHVEKEALGRWGESGHEVPVVETEALERRGYNVHFVKEALDVHFLKEALERRGYEVHVVEKEALGRWGESGRGVHLVEEALGCVESGHGVHVLETEGLGRWGESGHEVPVVETEALERRRYNVHFVKKALEGGGYEVHVVEKKALEGGGYEVHVEKEALGRWGESGHEVPVVETEALERWGESGYGGHVVKTPLGIWGVGIWGVSGHEVHVVETEALGRWGVVHVVETEALGRWGVSGHEIHLVKEALERRGYKVHVVEKEALGRWGVLGLEIYTDRDCDPAPHIRGPTIPFGISQASGSGSPVEGQGESSGGQDGDGGSGARSQGEGSDRGIGEEGDRDAEIGGGIGGGGQGEGNGDEGGNEGQGRVGDVEIRREARNARITRLPEIFIAFNVQSTAAATALHFLGLSSGDRGLLVSVLATNLVGFVCCTAALWPSHTSPSASGILARIGSAATSLGFILMIAMILPPYLLWMIVLACLAIFAVFIFSFMP